MRAITLTGFGDTSVFRMAQVAPPPLEKHSVRLRVKASGVNRADILQRKGLYPPPPGVTEILGLEVSGEVLECSPDVHDLKPGDRVMALLAGGGYADETVVERDLCLPLPENFSFIEGAATMEAFLTAHHNLFTLGGVFPEARVLIHAGASGVGTAGIQLLRELAREVWTTVGSPAKAKAVERLGARPILYKERDFAQAIHDAAFGRSVDVILDCIGARYLERNLLCLAPGGKLVLIGLMGGKDGFLDLARMLSHRLTVIGSTLRGLPLESKRSIVSKFGKDFLPVLATREISPIIDKVYNFSEVAEAHERMEKNLNTGKIVLAWSP